MFDSSSQVNITYSEDNTLANSRLANTPAPGSWTLNAAGDTTFNITVYLNPNVLPGVSQELTAITILHEALHGYFEFNGIYAGNALRQHELMGVKYVDLLRASLQSVYPYLSDPDANSLILYEMRDIATTTPTDFSALATYYNITTNTITNTGNSYKSGNTGTNGCTP